MSREIDEAKSKRTSEAVAAPEPPAMLSQTDLEKPVCVMLQESDCIWLLDLPGICANAETEEGKIVEEANTRWVGWLGILPEKTHSGNRLTDRFISGITFTPACFSHLKAGNLCRFYLLRNFHQSPANRGVQ